MPEEADKVSHASLNGIYVKAQELDRGHNAYDAPAFAPPGDTRAGQDASAHASSDAATHVSTHASEAQTQQPDAETHASDFDVETHASR